MRQAQLSTDFWELRSGEALNRQQPDTFWIPPLHERQNLDKGQAAKLIFDIEADDESGVVHLTGERMWVIVAERVDGGYVGILDNQPSSLNPHPDTYLCFGAEIPFLPEHVIDIATPPAEYVEWQLRQEPERHWPRDSV